MTQFVPILVLALVDSINPSALAVTLTLLTRGLRPSAVFAYVAGIFVTYLSAGVLLMFGVSALLTPLEGVLESRPVSVLGAMLGIAVLLYALLARNPKEGGEPAPVRHGVGGIAGLFVLGVTVTGLEFPTAFPYFGAVGILSAEALSFSTWFPVLIVYNFIFVLPPVLLMIGYRFLSERASERFVRRLRREARETMLWILGIVGFYLLVYSLSGLGVLDLPDTP